MGHNDDTGPQGAHGRLNPLLSRLEQESSKRPSQTSQQLPPSQTPRKGQSQQREVLVKSRVSDEAQPSKPEASPSKPGTSKSTVESNDSRPGLCSPEWGRRLAKIASHRKLKFLVLSFFDGVGAIWLALGSVFDLFAFSFEIDENCLAVLHKRFPSMEHLGCVSNFTRSLFTDLLATVMPDAVLVPGGSPCQQFSHLSGGKEGLAGKDSSFFWSFAKAVQVGRAECRNAGDLPFFYLLSL